MGPRYPECEKKTRGVIERTTPTKTRCEKKIKHL
jgi:hypothetical protein